MPLFDSEHYAKDADVVIRRLEEKYSDRGLMFTTPFLGAVPVQAFGHVDGERFYFRFRGNWGSLKVGPYVKELEDLLALRLNEDRISRNQKKLEKARSEGKEDYDYSWMDERPVEVIEEDNPHFLPEVITAVASQEGADPEDVYNGFLTDDEAFNMFSFLLENLTPVPVEKQMSEWTRVWLYEGREAADAYSAGKTQTG
jgi:hypothetical protein